MTSRERVIATLEGEVPDRIPCDLGSSFVTGITKIAYENLSNYLGRKADETELCDVIQQLAVVDEGLLKELEVDVRGLTPNMVRKRPVLEEEEDCDGFTDEWGVHWKKPKDCGLYFDLVKSPLSGELTEDDIEQHPWPDPQAPALFDGLREKALQYFEDGYAVILESLCAGIFEMSCRMLVECKISFYEKAAELFGETIQFIREGDDIGSQESLLISPALYRNYLKPRHQRLFEAQKELFPAPFYVFFHSDGAIYEILPDFVEAGLEVLNPVQVTGAGMSLTRLKTEFGKKISFWGGGVDTQHVLPRGTPNEVKADVRKRIEALAPDGGFIFGAIHNILGDVPPENILAMWETFREMRAY
jgi:uroporphyrinogen decarboxylase